MQKRIAFGLTLVTALTLLLLPIYTARAAEILVWEGPVSSNGTPVTTPTLVLGVTYRIVVISGVMLLGDVYADAQYHSPPIPTQWWVWLSGTQPDSHSFLQINSGDVDWGDFNNGWGDPLNPPYGGHSYETTWVGEDAPITFRIYDWTDEDYTNNICHCYVQIYREECGGFTPGFWKHNIGVAFMGKHGSMSSFTEDGPHLTPSELLGYIEAAGYTPQSAYAALTARGPGSEAIRTACANALNAAAGFGPFVD